MRPIRHLPERLTFFSVAFCILTSAGCEQGSDPLTPAPDAGVPVGMLSVATGDRVSSGFMSGGGVLIAPTGNPTIRASFAVNGSCDAAVRSHVSIHWPGGNTFTLNGPMGVVMCDGEPTPGATSAPFDTYRGAGLGIINGTEEAEVYFVMRDGGGAGDGNDMAAFVVQCRECSEDLYLWSQPCDPVGDAQGCMLPLTAGNLRALATGLIRR